MIKLSEALNTASHVCEMLNPYCDRIHIAGSIRRQKPDVKDIEIVCLPSHELVDKDFFTKVFKVKREFTHTINSFMNKIIKGNAEGRYMQIELKGGSVLDLFMPAPADYWRQLAIRTGSAEYSSFIIAGGWRRQGWCGVNSIGLRKISDCMQLSDKSWKCINMDGELPPVWQSEEEFFNWIKVQWIHPKFREVKHSINQYQ